MKKVRSSISSGCLGSCVTSRGEEDGVNDSPLAGLDGPQLTGGKIGDRLLAEAKTNLAIKTIPGLAKSYEVRGRGELQFGILLENMRRENFELSVSPPRVMYKIEKGVKLEPIEEVTIKVNEEHVGMVMEALSHRRSKAEKRDVVGLQEQVFVRKVIELHDKYLAYVNDCFMNHTLFHKFGKGIYFADLVSKSAQYCFTNKKNPVVQGLMKANSSRVRRGKENSS
ncbi:unnamed protein product [Lactuca saligna]|uniref:PARP catalytic domain-containing protein n=1 Tax=Lactuca saligna TaxID=75948 RepID=A0AA36DZZ0_LACSI|nr:unnamed protein product [Lactuca saligna]